MASGIETNRTYIDLPTEVSSEILQKTQEQSAVMQLARRITLPGRGLTIPVITSDPEAEWVAETNEKPVKNPGISQKVMQGYTLAVIVPFSNQFRREARILYDELVRRLPLALGQKFDATVFHGSAPGSNFDVLASCTAQLISTDPYAGLVAADVDIADNNGILNGFVISPKGRGILLAARDNDNRPLFLNSAAEGAIPVILGSKAVQSRAAYKAGTSPNPNVVGFAGDWTQAMYGIVDGINISISDQATLTTKDALDQTVTINLWQRNMFAIRAEIEVGFVADTYCFNRLTAAPGGATGATGATGETGE
ncbi:MAG: phage major capsid protein [Lachnospiraceae bacterium]|nr:phage major capsid protein [Lachnospiraceae bacterium]